MIAFNRQVVAAQGIGYIAQSLKSGHTSGGGPYTLKCQVLLRERLRSKMVLLTSSCTSALEMAALLAGIGPGDEVILPPFTFVSVANVFCLRGARPVFVDILPDTLNLDPAKLAEALCRKTKAIVAVHYAGIGCDMGSIIRVRSRRRVTLIEDAAHALGAEYKRRPLGTIGDFGVFSFHETKNFSCGEGGALSVNNAAFRDRAEVLWQKGTDRGQFLRGKVAGYRWIDTAGSYMLSDICAAYLFAQLERMEEINDARRRAFSVYASALEFLQRSGSARLPCVPPGCRHNGNEFFLLLEDPRQRDRLMRYLQRNGIAAVFHFLPLHLSPAGRALGYRKGSFPVTESVSERLLRLPLYYGMRRSDQSYVVDRIRAFFGKHGS